MECKRFRVSSLGSRSRVSCLWSKLLKGGRGYIGDSRRAYYRAY